MYREFWQLYVRDYGRLRLLLLVSALTVAVSLLEAINIGLLVPVLETLDSPGGDGGHWITRGIASLFEGLGIPFGLEPILLVLGLFIVIMAVLKYLRMLLVSKSLVQFTNWIRSKSMWSLMHADLSYYHQEKLGRLSDTLTTQSNQAGGSFREVVEILSNLGVILAFLAAAFLLSPSLTAIALGMLVLVSIAVQRNVVMARKIGSVMVNRSMELQANAVESLGAIHLIKSFLLERLRWADLNAKSQAFGETTYHRWKNLGQMSLIQETGLFTLIGGIVYLGFRALGLDLAVIIALLFVLYRLSPRVTRLNASRQTLANSLASLRQIKTVIEETSPTVVSGQKPFLALEKSIELKEVQFAYNGGAPVLQDANFFIERGKVTAIAGASGAGKTTVIDLLLRNYDPIQGKVLVDGVDLRELDLRSWHKSIGVVTQDVYLFNDTVANNISLGRPNVTGEDVVNAAKQAHAHDFVCQLPQGYQTLIGDRGWNLSGGQRQRLALARANLENPEILILDEATSSLDSESEQLIQDYINGVRGDRTIILVAHRLSTIRSADKIAVLRDGNIVEEGDWESLMAKAGVFANYYALQSNF